ncbi:MAG: phosphonopyruvate decarboxylase [Prevotella sp.]|nr:phosphonopyruvate decarboxylase [Paraprevotella sp.]MDD5855980.1 phosphonopyruvate decarboxylase [Prevotella sp.]MDY4407537.1 phosphonopyruvate decarboxylase [Prevotella sp.]
MIRPSFFYNLLSEYGIEFYAGVPDSLLKNLCAYITDNADKKNNIIAANEGGAIGLAAGYHLATGGIPVVYMQNSGLGNTINPLLSLTDKEVYNMPVLLVIGWRGEPNVHDEPQHIKQGKVTIPLLDCMGIRNEIIADNENDLQTQIANAVNYMKTTNEVFALVVKKGTFDSYKLKNNRQYDYALEREEAIQMVAASMDKKAVVVSTTGKISRELFEYRENSEHAHHRDFLTVGSMGHASQIALGIALNKPDRNIYCFDGDGAVIMHMGSMGIVGEMAPKNFFHIVFNNGAHDSVGGQPTIGLNIDIPNIAACCGYKKVISVEKREELQEILTSLAANEGPVLLEIKVKKGSRDNLGRPTTTPIENKTALMDFIQNS